MKKLIEPEATEYGFTDVNDMEGYLNAYHRKNERDPNKTGRVSYSAAFKLIRKMKKFAAVGDYTVLSFVARWHVRTFKRPPTTESIRSCINHHSKDFNGSWVGKKEILDNLGKTTHNEMIEYGYLTGKSSDAKEVM